jgi:hypothetical protein
VYFHAPYLTGLSFFSNEWNYERMPEFDEELNEDIEEFDVLDDAPVVVSKVTSITNELDIAVAAWHEEGRWR